MMRNRIKVLKRGTENMAPAAKLIMRLCIILSCVILVSSLLVGICAGEFTPHTYKLHYLTAELYRMPQGILLSGLVLSAFIQERFPS